MVSSNNGNNNKYDTRLPKFLVILFFMSTIVFINRGPILPSTYIGPPIEIVASYSEELLTSYDGSLNPMWTCSPSDATNQTDGSNKLIFVHVFKTAGSTFRRFLDSYGEKCGKAVSLIISCADVSTESLSGNQTQLWRDRRTGQPCINKQTRARDNSIVIEKQGVKAADLNEVDILGGHLPIGLGDHWIDEELQEPINAQYLAFFREPLAKFVSGRVYVHQHEHWTHEEALQAIRQYIYKSRSEGKYYNGYTKYLLTPQQKEETYTNEEKVRVMQRNLIQFNPIVGIVEEMGTSVALIQSVIDGDMELTEKIRQLDVARFPATPVGNQTKATVRNKSELSTSALVRDLKEDMECLMLLEELLKYEFEIYDFAVKLHHIQVERMKEQHGNKFLY